MIVNWIKINKRHISFYLPGSIVARLLLPVFESSCTLMLVSYVYSFEGLLSSLFTTHVLRILTMSING